MTRERSSWFVKGLQPSDIAQKVSAAAIGDQGHIEGTVVRATSRSPVTTPAKIDCYDQDDWETDDFMVTGYSEANGKFLLNYTHGNSVCGYWDCKLDGGDPDIYCIVSQRDEQSRAIIPFRTRVFPNHNQSETLNWGMITVYPDRRDSSCAVQPGCVVNSNMFHFDVECSQLSCCLQDCQDSSQFCIDEFYDLALSRCRMFGASNKIHDCYSEAYRMYAALDAVERPDSSCPVNSAVVLAVERMATDDGYNHTVDERQLSILIIAIIVPAALFLFLALVHTILRQRRRTENSNDFPLGNNSTTGSDGTPKAPE